MDILLSILGTTIFFSFFTWLGKRNEKALKELQEQKDYHLKMSIAAKNAASAGEAIRSIFTDMAKGRDSHNIKYFINGKQVESPIGVRGIITDIEFPEETHKEYISRLPQYKDIIDRTPDHFLGHHLKTELGQEHYELAAYIKEVAKKRGVNLNQEK